MADSFDPYYKWLGIPLAEQPANHYRLLGLPIFETDPDVVENAVDQRMAHVRTFQSGRHSALSQEVLNRLSAARICLLNPEKKADYDAKLKSVLDGATAIPEHSDRLPLPTPLKLPSLPSPSKPPIAQAAPMPQAVSLQQRTPGSSRPAMRIPKKKGGWVLPAALGIGSLLVVGAVIALVVTGAFRSPDEETAAVDDEKTNTPVEDSSDDTKSKSKEFSPPSADQLSRFGVRVTEKGYVLLPEIAGLDSESTIELWQRLDRIDASRQIIGGSRKVPGTSRVISWQIYSKQEADMVKLTLWCEQGGRGALRTQADLKADELVQWHHLAVCRSEKTVKVFINGKPRLTCNLRASYEADPNPVRIGVASDPRQRAQIRDSHGEYELRGLRISSNSRYGGLFTPPDKFESDSTTVVNLDFSKPEARRIIDISNEHDAVLVGAHWVKSDGTEVKLADEVPPVQVGKTWTSPNPTYGSLEKISAGWLRKAPTRTVEYQELDRTNEYVELAGKDSIERLRIYGDKLLRWHPTKLIWGNYLLGQWESSDTSVVSNPTQPVGGFAIRNRMSESDHIRLTGTHNLTDSSRSFTVEFWIRVNNTAAGNCYVIGDRVHAGQHPAVPAGSPAVGWNLWFNEEGNICFIDQRSPIKIETNKWTHIALCREKASTNLFVNGKRSSRFDIAWPSGIGDLFLGCAPGLAFRSPRTGQFDIAGLRISVAVVYSGSTFPVPAKLEKFRETAVLLDFSTTSGDKIVDLSGKRLDAEIHGAEWIELDGTLIAPSTIPPVVPTIPQVPVVEKKLDVPDETEQASARAEIRSIFATQFENAKTNTDAKVSLARELIRVASDNKVEPKNRFVLLTDAQMLAVEGGAIDLAFDTAEAVASIFDVDALAELGSLIERAGSTARATSQREALIKRVLKSLDWFVAEGRFDLADTAMQTAHSIAARTSINKDLRIAARAKQKEIAVLNAHWSSAKEAENKLKQDPGDSQAHLAVGRYECLVRRSWEDGLEHLSKSSGAALKTAADKDLSQSNDAESQIIAGDAWWDLAKESDGYIGRSLLLRARHWYELAFPSASAIARLRVKERLESTKEIAKENPRRSTRFTPKPAKTPGVSNNTHAAEAGIIALTKATPAANVQLNGKPY